MAATTATTSSGTSDVAHNHEIPFPATASAAHLSCAGNAQKAPLASLPTRTFLRSLFLTSAMASPLLTPCLLLMKLLVDSPSKLLRPSSNPAMDYLLRRTIYDHFCAGTNEVEVRQTVHEMKRLGYKGVILGYARESIAHVNQCSHQETRAAVLQEQQQQAQWEEAVEEWKEGNLRTLKMLGEGDYLAIKFTGAGPLAVHSLTRSDPLPPPQIKAAIYEICAAVAAQKSRLWIDAEQQVFQAAIDSWAVDLMRMFNRPGEITKEDTPIVVLNTYQAYLKRSADILAGHLRLARKEGWGVGVKLVRGAYIAHDQRDKIWKTKEETDTNYNGVVRAMIEGNYPSSSTLRGTGSELESQGPEDLPTVRLFVASHNGESVAKACTLYQQRRKDGRKTIPVEVGQLQGMADEVSLGMVAAGGHAETKPGVFKCLAWGSTEECLHFLLRRAVENQSAMQRTKDTAQALRGEAWRRAVAFMRVWRV
ncbi:putative proline oxidase Put1 [Aspergillus saccharolyticus JOP 1030-1]|uniref:Proline dehydrogenase n=1 Tax=Aspergillus saccharolyticus JOP 1030-1 TaxID=1450539 RepID=A0A318ZAZ6_9EURO|nr:FAD-linked oxidoreductase [Aspergillus saccharolyticus JOP 1030-1]PYH44615.1 FAD-linked oxidoreductase [Aspergillus saccharolyticus JOP 1030-1]